MGWPLPIPPACQERESRLAPKRPSSPRRLSVSTDLGYCSFPQTTAAKKSVEFQLQSHSPAGFRTSLSTHFQLRAYYGSSESLFCVSESTHRSDDHSRVVSLHSLWVPGIKLSQPFSGSAFWQSRLTGLETSVLNHHRQRSPRPGTGLEAEPEF